jgi:competence protein ComEA
MSSDPDADGGRGADGSANERADKSQDGLALLAPRARRMPRSVRMRLGLGAGVILLIVALLVTVIVSVVAPRGATQKIAAVTAQTGRGAPSTSAPTGTASVGVLYVHVLGAVSRPGLYELRAGTRVIDAIGAAGGFADDADHGGVNLARLLSDGEQLVVPKVGQAPPAGSAAAPAGASGAASGAVGPKVNLNTATEAELETLPRIGPAMASRIVQWRKDNGRFSTVDDLMNITGIGDKTFDALKDLVTT